MGHEQQAVIVFNATFIRPAKFYINGLTNHPHAKYFYIFLSFVYAFTVLGNGFLIFLIYFIKSLHTAKYMIVFNLAFIDLCESSAMIPRVLETFLFDRRYIAYEACLSNMFFVLCFASIQSWTLLTMAYDRLIAICFPLRYHVIMTKQRTAALLAFVWVFLVILVAFCVGIIDRLSFCRSLVINSFYCDYGLVFELACNDNSLHDIMAYVCFILILCIPPIIIAITYICILVALFRIASRDERIKAMKTCTSHLILVIIFFIPVLGTNIAAVATYISPNGRIINSTITHTIPSLLNPIIYSLKTEEVLMSIKMLYNRGKVNKTLTKELK